MKIEVGKRYRFEPNGASAYMLPAQTVILDPPIAAGGAPSIMFASGTVMHVLQDGTIAGLGKLVELEPEPATVPTASMKLPPTFGGSEELRRLQQRFANERDLTLGTS